MSAGLRILLMILVSAPVLAKDDCKTMERTLQANGVQVLDLNVHVGQARIVASADERIHVSVTACETHGWFARHKAAAKDAQLLIEQRSARVEISLGKDQYREHWKLAIPAGIALDADVGVGEVRIEALSADIDLDLGVGDVAIETRARHYGEMHGDVGVGNITLRAVEGRVEEARAIVAMQASWHADGPASMQIDVGVGDIDIELD